ncbi:MAG: aminotransferase class V-fold PLP-dependent enzyme, partial [Gemmatimonadetes bacterium]|nr:aminotransferase class V-fold PLP-dependent enzyme [Gemmatimonadota bacterium]
MDRRAFLAAGSAALAGASCGLPDTRQAADATGLTFPRSEHETFLNAAGGMPLASFAEAGLARYMDFIRLGPDDGRGEYFNQMWSEIRGDFGAMIGAKAEEIALVHSTKAGEQLVMDGLPALREGGNLVTNDFHFSGSLHNLSGMRDAGFDVRIVKSDGKDLPLEAMTGQIDDRTALVSITLLSNVNGRIEPVRALADAVHDAGGYLYADIIQAAGIHPIDVEAMGIDFAACSAYKWLFGVHGTGFFYVREGLDTEALTRHARFPGSARHN